MDKTSTHTLHTYRRLQNKHGFAKHTISFSWTPFPHHNVVYFATPCTQSFGNGGVGP